MIIETRFQLTLLLINGIITLFAFNILSNIHPVTPLFVGWFDLNILGWIVYILLLLFARLELTIVCLCENARVQISHSRGEWVILICVL